jgi:hypothetical protein
MDSNISGDAAASIFRVQTAIVDFHEMSTFLPKLKASHHRTHPPINFLTQAVNVREELKIAHTVKLTS